MKQRHSDRMFSDRPVEEEKVEELCDLSLLCPSSCDRKAVSTIVVTERDQKALLGGLLVGGVGWVHRAPVVILLMADPVAYKAGDEVNFMPFLDAGTIVQQLSLAATSMGLSGCFINPNIREHNKEHFHKVFGNGLFCGAYALGYPYQNKAPSFTIAIDESA